ncbi:MAG: thiosulfohydrolase SoxB, partial [Hyphomicrobiaceae bacterium]
MLSRREFGAVAAATLAVAGAGTRRLASAERLGLDQLMRFSPKGQVTLLHMTDCHAQLMPLYYREPSTNLGVGEMRGLPPHLTGKAALAAYGLEPG